MLPRRPFSMPFNSAFAAMRARNLMRQVTALVLAVSLCLASVPQRARAQGGIQFVRDAEIDVVDDAGEGIEERAVRADEHGVRERGERDRKWYSPQDAAALVAEPDLAELIADFRGKPKKSAA